MGHLVTTIAQSQNNARDAMDQVDIAKRECLLLLSHAELWDGGCRLCVQCEALCMWGSVKQFSNMNQPFMFMTHIHMSFWLYTAGGV